MEPGISADSDLLRNVSLASGTSCGMALHCCRVVVSLSMCILRGADPLLAAITSTGRQRYLDRPSHGAGQPLKRSPVAEEIDVTL